MNFPELNEAVRILREGGVILYPTDTVWGLGCDATNAEAVERIFRIKQREDAKSLITLMNGSDMLCRYVRQVPEIAWSLIEVNDQPMTLVYPGAQGLAPKAVAEDGSAAIRIPQHDFCLQLITRLQRPLISTSANRSGLQAPARFAEISAEIKEAVDWIAPQVYEKGATCKPSSLMKLGLGGEIQIIRP